MRWTPHIGVLSTAALIVASCVLDRNGQLPVGTGGAGTGGMGGVSISVAVVGGSRNVGGFGAAPAGVGGNGGSGGDLPMTWSSRKSITISASEVEAAGDALSNFPLLIATIDPDLQASALPSGDDIRFVAEGGAPLAFEIESYSAGQLFAWVRIPSLSANDDTVIYLQYGNPNATSASDGAATFATDYEAVYHMGQPPPADAVDVTDKGHDASATGGTSVGGLIQRGIELDGLTDFFDIGQIDLGDTFTLSIWIYPHDVDAFHAILSNRIGGATVDGFTLRISDSAQVVFGTGNGTTSNGAPSPDGAVLVDTWHLVHAVVDRASALAEVYVDGVEISQNSVTTPDYNKSAVLHIGQNLNGTGSYDGIIDEVRITQQLRSAEWISTTHRNQRDPSAFVTYGVEEPVP